MSSCCVNNRLQTRFLNGWILLILQIPSSAPLGNNQPCSSKSLDAHRPFHWMYAICLSESYILDFLRLSLPGHDPLHPSSSGHTRHKASRRDLGVLVLQGNYRLISNQREKKNHPAPLAQRQWKITSEHLSGKCDSKGRKQKIRDAARMSLCFPPMRLGALQCPGQLSAPSDWPLASEFPKCFWGMVLCSYHQSKRNKTRVSQLNKFGTYWVQQR